MTGILHRLYQQAIMNTIVLDRLVSVLPAEAPESAATVSQAAIEISAKRFDHLQQGPRTSTVIPVKSVLTGAS